MTVAKRQKALPQTLMAARPFTAEGGTVNVCVKYPDELTVGVPTRWLVVEPWMNVIVTVLPGAK